MLKPSSEIRAASLLIGLVLSCFLNAQELAAQSPSSALVVVADASVADCVQRIGREHVQVRLLISSELTALQNGLHAVERRARSLLEFRLLVTGDDTSCPRKGFWCERITAANPRGKVHHVRRSRHFGVDEREVLMQRATDIHRALASILPDHLAALDANLEFEIRRLRAQPFFASRLALSRRTPGDSSCSFKQDRS